MATWPRRMASALGTGAVAGVVAVGIASRRWHSATERQIRELTDRASRAGGAVSFDALAELPAPVQRYFQTVLREGRPRIRAAHVSQVGDFRSNESADIGAGWRPFEARQVLTADPPGFVWDARIRMAPLAAVRVRDAYLGGRASMRGALLAIVPVVDAADSPELRAGALQRYLAESVWLPTALLPGERMQWSPVDDTHAWATLSDGGISVTLEFEFAPSGEIISTYTAGRQRAAGAAGAFVTLPWGGRYRRYEEHGGVRVPVESEVFWVVDGKEQPYYRGQNLTVSYDYGAE
jgi:hypothetical protein